MPAFGMQSSRGALQWYQAMLGDSIFRANHIATALSLWIRPGLGN